MLTNANPLFQVRKRPGQSLVATGTGQQPNRLHRSLVKEGPLTKVRPPPCFASISCRGLKLTWKGTQGLAQSTVHREFPLSGAQGCGETGLHTQQGVNYTAAPWFTLLQGAQPAISPHYLHRSKVIYTWALIHVKLRH